LRVALAFPQCHLWHPFPCLAVSMSYHNHSLHMIKERRQSPFVKHPMTLAIPFNYRASKMVVGSSSHSLPKP
jgi:hypothetical protein